MQNPIDPGPQSVAIGRETFSQACARCHGDGGKGNGPEVAGLSDKPMDLSQPYMRSISDGELFWIISNGWYGMPAFKQTITEEQTWHLVNFVRSIQQ